MDYGTILLFFVYTYGLGFAADLFLKNDKTFLEKNIMRIGLGIGIWAFLGTLFALIGIPLDWRIFLILSLIAPAYHIIKNYKTFKTPKISIRQSDIFVVIAILLCIGTLHVYNKGSFSYPWLEDDDSWNHATGVKLVADAKSIQGPTPVQYIDPYPPAYNIMLGVLHQTSPSLQWTLKYFNNLIIALSILFFYFFVQHFSNNRMVGILSAFFVFSIPSYLSHFIWAHSLVVLLFIISLYCIEQVQKDRKWVFAASLLICASWFVQPTQPIKFFVLYAVYILTKIAFSYKESLKVPKIDRSFWIVIGSFVLILATFILGYLESIGTFLFPLLACALLYVAYHAKNTTNRTLFAIISGYVLSFLWYATRLDAIVPKSSGSGSGGADAGPSNPLIGFWEWFTAAFPTHSGTATRAYSFNEIVYAQHQNMINNPIGIGVVLSLLIAIGVVAIFLSAKKAKHPWKIIALLCAVLTFLGFNSMTFNLPIGFFGFRFWMLFALFGAIVAAIGTTYLTKLFKPVGIIIIALVVLGVLFTSAHQKHSVNTATWPPGLGWQSYQEVNDYTWLTQNLPIDTPIFAFTANDFVIGFDMYTCSWCEGNKEFHEQSMNVSMEELHLWLRENEYQFVIVDQRAVREFGGEAINVKLQELIDSTSFRPVHQAQTFVLLAVA